MTGAPRRLVTIAAISGAPARILAAILPLSEVESRMDAVGIAGPHRAAVIDCWRSIEAAGRLHVAASGTPAGQAAAAGADSQRDSITTTEAATMLNLSARRTRQLAARGELHGRQIARRWQFTAADVAAYDGRRHHR